MSKRLEESKSEQNTTDNKQPALQPKTKLCLICEKPTLNGWCNTCSVLNGYSLERNRT